MGRLTNKLISKIILFHVSPISISSIGEHPFFKKVACATLASGLYSTVAKIEKGGIAPLPAKYIISVGKISPDLKVGIARFIFSK